jgi:hypothetical protein
MRKKLIFGGLVLLALVLTTGTFAYTYTNYGAATLNASFVDAAYNTVTPSGSPPAWNGVLPIIYNTPQYIRPNAVGSLTQNTPVGAATDWQAVDDISPDDSATYIVNSSTHTHTDFYGIQNVTPSANDIVGIRLYFRIQGGGGGSGTVQPAIILNGTTYFGAIQVAPSGSWTTYNYEWQVSPDTNTTWTEAEVDSLEAGVALTKYAGSGDVECTQVYIMVEYQLVITSGTVPLGGLFEVTPASGFSGDLTVSLYLLNTEDLLKAYRYLNIQAYLTDSVEAGESPDFRVISLDNGAATFTIQGGTAATYYLNVSGGGYAVTSDNISGWAPGWSVTPQFYCEVSQR